MTFDFLGEIHLGECCLHFRLPTTAGGGGQPEAVSSLPYLIYGIYVIAKIKYRHLFHDIQLYARGVIKERKLHCVDFLG